jgi:hypothetical protein
MRITEIVNIINRLNAPWSLHFERDGTEDAAILFDGNGEELATNRPFWLPEGDGPIPSTLSAMRLMEAAPRMVEALRLALTALNTAPRFKVGETNSYAIASEIERTLSEALDDGRMG